MVSWIVFLSLGFQRPEIVDALTGRALVIGRHRYELRGGNDSLAFRGGELVRKNWALTWVRNGKTLASVDLKLLVADWLKDDQKWGGHKMANQMRYMASEGGGVSAELAECYEQTDQCALGLLDFHFEGPSGEPVAAQFLVTIETKPFSLQLVRRLAMPSDSLYGALGARRLYPTSKDLYSLEDGKVEVLGKRGEKVSDLCGWTPNEFPRGFCAGRWIVGQVSTKDLSRIIATDLQSGKSFDLLRFVSDTSGKMEPPDILAVEESSQYILFEQRRNDNAGGQRYFTIHVPDGPRQSVAGDASDVAGPYVINIKEKGFELFWAKTGKRTKGR